MSAVEQKARQTARESFPRFEKASAFWSARVLEAFHKHRVSDTHFAATSGYGYNDSGRDTLDAVYADVFGAEDALVRMQFVSGTHAISCALRAACPGGGYLSLCGHPYDTLRGVMPYEAVDTERCPDYDAIGQALSSRAVPAVLLQRSRGYSDRKSLSCDEIAELIRFVKTKSPDTIIVVDNCYGEFVGFAEPPMLGADLTAGSLIKNPGGGCVPGGGYIAGRKDLVERAAECLTAPGIGRHCGASHGHNRLMYQGLFMAPHTVAEALKTAEFAAALLSLAGYQADPAPGSERHDIIQRIDFGAPEPLRAFCEGIQAGSPVDSFCVPEPWDMPGYNHQVIMAAGTFIQGASLELSCDAPMRPPYSAFLQGGLSYEMGSLGVLSGVRRLCL